MRCKRCSKQVREEAYFCDYCGKEVEDKEPIEVETPEVIRESRLKKIRSPEINVRVTQEPSANYGLGMEYAMHSNKSYIGYAFLTILLYFFTFWIGGFVANILFLNAARNTKRIIKRDPPGMVFLIALLIFAIISLLLGIIIPLSYCSRTAPTTTTYTGYGGNETVSGSMHCIKVDEALYLVDAGIFYGEDGSNYPLPENLDIDNLKAVFITHGHADHIGRIPLLLEQGYLGPIYMNKPSYDITKVMLESSIKYMDFGEEDFYYSKNNKSEIKPVYLDGFDFGDRQVLDKNKIYIKSKREDLQEKGFYMSHLLVDKLVSQLNERLQKQVNIVEYHKPFQVDEINVEFFPTSHIPGSALILLDIFGTSILFSGDLGSDNNPFLQQDIFFEKNIDYLFVEATYGVEGDNSGNETERSKFQQIIGEKVEEGYRIIIPAFVLDRTQQVLYEIQKGMENNHIPSDTIIKAYSPTSEKITDLYIDYSKTNSSDSLFFNQGNLSVLEDMENLVYNPKKSDGSYDMDIQYGEIAVMSSGMVSSVFSKDAVNAYIEDPKTFIAIVGYQAEDTVGRSLIDAAADAKDTVVIDGSDRKINPENIFRSYAFNSHADLGQIFGIFKEASPKKIFLVHLNKDTTSDLIKEYQNIFNETEIIVPIYGESYDLN